MTKQQILKTYLSYHVKGLVSYYYGVRVGIYIMSKLLIYREGG